MHEDDPTMGAPVNIEGFVNTVDQARQNGCDIVVYASMSSIYGNRTELSPESMYVAVNTGRCEQHTGDAADEVRTWIEANSRLTKPTVRSVPYAFPSRVWIATRNRSSSDGATRNTDSPARTSRMIGSETMYGSITLLMGSTSRDWPTTVEPNVMANAVMSPPTIQTSSPRVGTWNMIASRPRRHRMYMRPMTRDASSVAVWLATRNFGAASRNSLQQ